MQLIFEDNNPGLRVRVGLPKLVQKKGSAAKT